MNFTEIISHPFTWGLLLGLFFTVLAFVSHFKTKREYKRYRRHLSDRMELESNQLETFKKEKDRLLKENENLRIKVGMLGDKPEQNAMRELEILARAEKSLMVNAPGFAPAWETAKSAALEEVASEESGKSIPKKIFRKFFGGGQSEIKEATLTALPEESSAPEPEKTMESDSSTDSKS